MKETFKCPICNRNSWELIEKYLFSKDDITKPKRTKYFSIINKLNFVRRVLLRAKPRRYIVSRKYVTPYQRIRREVLFNVWFKNKNKLTINSIFCKTCGFACFTPRPEDKDIIKKYEYLEKYNSVHSYQKEHDSYTHKLDQKRANRIYELCNKYSTNKQLEVLDYGGATGKIMIPFLDNHHKCYIIDYNNKPIDGILKLGDDINHCKIDKKFDIIICSHVLEHVSDISNLVIKLKEHLKPDGIIYAEIPQQIWAGIYIDADPVTHINFFTMNSFANLFLYNGFKILEINQKISNYAASYMDVVWIIAKLNKPDNISFLPSDIRKMLFPSRFYSIKKLFNLLILPKLNKYKKR